MPGFRPFRMRTCVRAKEDRSSARSEAPTQRAGWSLARIARELGVAKSSVSVSVRGLEPQGTPSPPPRPVDAMPTVRLRVWRSGSVRRCGRCGRALPTESFNRLGGGLQVVAKVLRRIFPGARRHAPPAVEGRQVGAATSSASAAARSPTTTPLRRLRRIRPGGARVRPHRREDGEDFRPALSDRHPKAIDAEIARCEVVCTNCTVDGPRIVPAGAARRLRSRWRALTHSHVERNVPSLRRPPSGGVRGLRRARSAGARVRSRRPQARRRHAPRLVRLRSPATIDAEIARCEIRCANCHRRMTAKRGGHFRFRVLSSAMPP